MTDGEISSRVPRTPSTWADYARTENDEQPGRGGKERALSQDPWIRGVESTRSRIRFCECILQTARENGGNAWVRVGTRAAWAKEGRSENVFWKETGLSVDTQNSGGNETGKVTRRFFENQTFLSQIRWLDRRLVWPFAIVLNSLTDNYEISLSAFEKHAKGTAQAVVGPYIVVLHASFLTQDPNTRVNDMRYHFTQMTNFRERERNDKQAGNVI